jgi:hypothetical protein
VCLRNLGSAVRQNVDNPNQLDTRHFGVQARVVLTEMTNSDDCDFHT